MSGYARMFWELYKLPTVIARLFMVYGPAQKDLTKLIPYTILSLARKEAPKYSSGQRLVDWIYVEDNCEAIARVLEEGRIGETYNISGNATYTNREIVDKLLERLGKQESHVEYVQDRPGHDRRYAVNSTKIAKELGWKPKMAFEDALSVTIEWYAENRRWWEAIKSGDYRQYYEAQYGCRSEL